MYTKKIWCYGSGGLRISGLVDQDRQSNTNQIRKLQILAYYGDSRKLSIPQGKSFLRIRKGPHWKCAASMVITGQGPRLARISKKETRVCLDKSLKYSESNSSTVGSGKSSLAGIQEGLHTMLWQHRLCSGWTRVKLEDGLFYEFPRWTYF